MDFKEATRLAKTYINDVLAEEHVTNVGVEETEHDVDAGRWFITVGFSRPWNTPRTRAQEVLEKLGSFPNLKRSYKIVSISDDGDVLSMKNRPRSEPTE